MPATLSAPPTTSAPAAPSKPTSPASPPPAQKSPTSPPPPTSKPTEDQGLFGDTFAELDAIDQADKDKTKAKSKPAESASQQSESVPADNAADATKEESETTTESPKDAGSAKPATESQPVKPVKAAELREAYNNAKQKNKEYESQIAQLSTKLKQLETQGPEQSKPLLEKLAALEKENTEYREELKFTNYVKSPEFNEKYQKPYNDAWAKAVREVEQLTVTDSDGNTRQATANDILALANSPLSTLDERAETMFGRSSARVIRHIEKIRDLAEAQEKAITDAKANGAEREKSMRLHEEQRRVHVGKIIEGTNKQLSEKYPRWFGHEDTDSEGNQVFDKGLQYVDEAFNPSSTLQEDQRVQRMVVIRNKAANHDRLALHLKKLTGELKELKATLAEYEKSEPTTGKAADAVPAKSGDWLSSAEAEIDALDRR